MLQNMLRHLGLILIGIAVAMPVGAAARAGAPDIPAPMKPLPTQVNNEGQVTVKVTPLLTSTAADVWRFEVQLDTHVTPLNQDLLAAAVLVDAGGNDQRPVAWEGDPPGGHHRKGILLFRSIGPLPGSLTLKIRRVGSVPERSFTWTLTAP